MKADVAPDPNDFWSFTHFAKHLGGLKPRATLAWLKDRLSEAASTEAEYVDLNGTRVPVKEMSEIFCRNIWGAERVSPDGAALLVRLHTDGALIYNGSRPGPVGKSALEYIASKEVMLEKAARIQAENAEYQRKVLEPATIRVEEFTFRLLDDVFWKHHGPGGGSLEIGGVVVEKRVSTLSSNSGKTRDSAVTFYWREGDGSYKTLSKPSAFEGNRRNDAERNWGLPG